MEDNFQNEIEKIRKKTFNPELQRLVNGVIQKEGQTHVSEDNSYTLLEKIHRLFYMSLNLLNSESCNDSDFTSEPGVSLTTENNIFSDIGINDIRIMRYNDDLKVYEIDGPVSLENLSDEFVFSPSEKIYRNIISSKKPLKLDMNVIHENETDKRFHFISDNEFYAVSFNTVLKEIWSRYASFSNSFDFSKLSPVILFTLDGSFSQNTFFKKNLIRFYFRLYSTLYDFSHNPEKITNMALTLEKYFTEMSVHDDISLYVIKIRHSFSDEFYFLLKFLKNKLDKSVMNPARIALTDKNTIFAFINNADSRRFLEETDNFSSQYENCFEITKINNFSNISISSILEKIK